MQTSNYMQMHILVKSFVLRKQTHARISSNVTGWKEMRAGIGSMQGLTKSKVSNNFVMFRRNDVRVYARVCVQTPGSACVSVYKGRAVQKGMEERFSISLMPL